MTEKTLPTYTDEEIMRALRDLGITVYQAPAPPLESNPADVVGAIWLNGEPECVDKTDEDEAQDA